MRKNREFARVLKKLRSTKGFSQENLSLEADLARTYISLLERELRSPSLKTINKICEVLEILPSNFMELIEQEKNKIQDDNTLLNTNDNIPTQVLYSHIVDVVGNTLNLIVLDQNLSIQYANQNFSDLLEYKKNDLLNLNLSYISDPNSINNLQRTIKHLDITKNYTHSDIICKNKRGETIYFTAALIPYSKDVNHTLVVLIDFTDYKKTQKELLNSQENLGLALSATNQIIWKWNVSSHQISIFSMDKEKFGHFPTEKFININKLKKEIHPQDLSKIMNILDKEVNFETLNYDIEYRVKINDGPYRWKLAKGKIIEWDDSLIPTKVIGTSFDITEKKKTEEALQLNDARLESLKKLNEMINKPIKEITDFAASEMVKLTQSNNGVIFMANKNNTLKLYSYSDNALKNCGIQNKEKIDHHFEPFGIFKESAIKQKSIIDNHHNQKQIPYPQGHITISKVMCTPIIEKNNVTILAAVSNKKNDYNPSDSRQLELLMQGLWRIIQHKNHLELKEKKEKNLFTSSRLASMNVLCRCIAHEVNNPLTLIQQHNDELKESINYIKQMDGNFIKTMTEQVDEMVDRISSVMKGMKSFIQDSALGFLKNIPLEELLNNTINFVKTKIINDNIKLIIVNELPHNCTIDCHPSQIAECVLNIIYNSIDAIYNLDDKWIKIELRELKDDYIKIIITDSGHGISPNLREKIFDPFFTTKKNYRGHGLGLTISKDHIEGHHGTLILNTEQTNCCFEIKIPKHQKV